MLQPFSTGMREVLELTKGGNLGEATALIRQSLAPDGARPLATSPAASTAAEPPIDVVARRGPALPPPDPAKAGRSRPAAPAGAGLVRRTFRGAHGSLDYLLYVPAQGGEGMPLVVMLHGCTQSAEDFARGTRMVELAEELGFIAAFPEQTKAANAQKCWNWFRPGDQGKNAGEPALIAGITREIIASERADPARIYVAGLSAGGAAAAIMADACPDLYAAAGIHSGLACGSARDLPSAFAAMQGKARPSPASASGTYVPLITFHGDRDATVHPANSEQILSAWSAAPELASLERKVSEGESPAGRRYRCTALVDADGRSLAESWQVVGAGHAWSGGAASGSYTDPSGPDASREMLRFFFQHRLEE